MLRRKSPRIIKKYYTGSEKYPPPGILFTPANNPLIHGANGVGVRNGAQLDPKGYNALCGPISLLAILNASGNDIDINKIIKLFTDQGKKSQLLAGGFDAKELRTFMQKAFPNWNASTDETLPKIAGKSFEELKYNSSSDLWALEEKVRMWLSREKFIVFGVEIVYGDTNYNFGGWVGRTEGYSSGDYINHWVVVTGISTPFNKSKADPSDWRGRI